MEKFLSAYGRYKQCRNASWHCLLDFEISSFPVKLTPITRQLKIKVIKNSDINELNENECGASIFDGSSWYIIYKDSEDYRRNRFTIAHELGHILLGHEMQKGYYYKRSLQRKAVKPAVETEADGFAIRLLAPACVLWGLDIHSAEEISDVCDISYSAAKIRENRMKTLYKRNKFLASPLEKQVFKNFQPYINHFKDENHNNTI